MAGQVLTKMSFLWCSWGGQNPIANTSAESCIGLAKDRSTSSADIERLDFDTSRGTLACEGNAVILDQVKH